MLNWLIVRIAKRQIDEAYDKGTVKGYQVGYQAGQVEGGNRSYLDHLVRLNSQLKEILDQKGWV